MEGLIRAWGKILRGIRPNLSVELTRECPLTCPGCYAYGDDHLGGATTLRQLGDYRGDMLVDRFFDLIDRERPLHVSIVGGEPLVRYRELTDILPRMAARGIYTQLVTSAVRPIPLEWATLPRLRICVSIDGLQPEHDARRAPATYARILQHIEGQAVTVHCTVTRQQVQRDGYLDEFVDFWSLQSAVKQIYMSLYTPQVGEMSDERLSTQDRQRVLRDFSILGPRYPKLLMNQRLLDAYAAPPVSPDQCTFARTTTCLSADLQQKVTPCQFGGDPDCASCGCLATVALEAVARRHLPGGIRVGSLFDASLAVGRGWRAIAADRRSPEPSV